MFEAACKAALEVGDIEQERSSRRDERDLDVGKFMSLFHDTLHAGLKETRKEKVRHLLWTAVGMTLYCQKNERVVHMFCGVFMYN